MSLLSLSWLARLLIPLLLWPGLCLAQSQGTNPSKPAPTLADIAACVRQVRQVHPRPDPMNQFDAHVAPAGDIRISGTEEETRLFRECMQHRGVPKN
jgi:hypothetical protein